HVEEVDVDRVEGTLVREQTEDGQHAHDAAGDLQRDARGQGRIAVLSQRSALMTDHSFAGRRGTADGAFTEADLLIRAGLNTDRGEQRQPAVCGIGLADSTV